MIMLILGQTGAKLPYYLLPAAPGCVLCAYSALHSVRSIIPRYVNQIQGKGIQVIVIPACNTAPGHGTAYHAFSPSLQLHTPGIKASSPVRSPHFVFCPSPSVLDFPSSHSALASLIDCHFSTARRVWISPMWVSFKGNRTNHPISMKSLLNSCLLSIVVEDHGVFRGWGMARILDNM